MEHKEYKRICRDGDTAVLFIHGIVGTPNHFTDYVKIVPEHISAWNILLDGHGKTVQDFSNTSMKKWEQQVQKAVRELAATHEKIYMVAHSMGTLFAIEQALRCKKIKKLFLIAVPTIPAPKLQMYSSAMKIYLGRIKPDDTIALAAQSSYSIGQDKNPFHYIGWLPRYLELFAKGREIRKVAGRLTVPCVIYQSVKDDMVSMRSVKCFENNPNVSVIKLPNSGHYFYDEKEYAYLLKEFRNFLD